MCKYGDVGVTLKPIFHLTKLFGLTPFNSNEDNRKVVTLNLIWCSMLILFILFTLYKWLIYGTREGIVVRMADILVCCAFCFSLISSIIKNYFERYNILKLIADLSKIDNLIKTLNFNNYNTFLNYKHRKKCFFAVIMTNIAYLLILSYFLHAEIVEMSYIMHFTFLCPSLVVMQFYAIILLIKDRFALLNNEVTFLIGNCNSIVNLTKIKNGVTLVELKNIIILHGKLSSLSKNLNKIYSISILSFISYHLISAYSLIFYVLIKTTYEHVLLFVFLVQIIYSCISIFALISISSGTSREANKIRNLLDPILKSGNQFLNLRVTNFNLYLLENKLNFTACGLFILNEKLIYEIFAAVVKYSLILLGLELGVRNSIIYA